MEYTVKFKFDCINKRSLISRKSGEANITYDGIRKDLKKSKELILLIANDMANKTRQSIISVDVEEIVRNNK